jgi:hypothetical protein
LSVAIELVIFLEYDKSLQLEGGMGLLWYAEKKYNDFVLKIDWKVNRKNDNSGIFVRFSDPDNDPWIATILLKAMCFLEK